MSDIAFGRRFATHETYAPALPVGSIGHQASGYFGIWWLIATEGALFAYLLFSYAYCAMQSRNAWPPSGPPPLALASTNTLILLASSVAVFIGERAIKRGLRVRSILGLTTGFLLGVIFVGIQLMEWRSKGTALATNLYSSFYFTTTGFHMAHVAVGLLGLAALIFWSLLGKFDATSNSSVSIGALYWHFVDAVWLAVFTTYYLVPHVR
ncbi:MAG: hypothetical protein NVSMB26_18580 [Beijerinckiaceae bacterium]